MKKLFPILFCFLWLSGCRSAEDTPERVAWGFLHAYYAKDYEGAIRYADEKTKAELDREIGLLRASGISKEEIQATVYPVIIEVEGIIANDGYRAVCAYKLKNSRDDANAMMETLMLFKTDAGWKVSF